MYDGLLRRPVCVRSEGDVNSWTDILLGRDTTALVSKHQPRLVRGLITRTPEEIEFEKNISEARRKRREQSMKAMRKYRSKPGAKAREAELARIRYRNRKMKGALV